MSHQKYNSSHPNAVGYWGSEGTWRITRNEEIPEKMRVELQDKLLARGLRVHLWLPVNGSYEGAISCTCTKDTTSTAERLCFTCFGTKFAPGFYKFQHQLIFASSASAEDYTLTDCTLDRVLKPNRIMMNAGATSATIETSAFAYTNPNELDWTTHTEGFVRATGSTVVVEFSTDAGVTYTNITDINGINKPVATGNVQFRITLTRLSASDASPAWEITRLQRPARENVNKVLKRLRPDMVAGEILVLRTQTMERVSVDSARGVVTEHKSDRTWTSPLDWFDSTLSKNVPAARIADADAGLHPFYEYTGGVQLGTRYALTQINYNETLGVFTHQSFSETRAQAGEPYAFVPL